MAEPSEEAKQKADEVTRAWILPLGLEPNEQLNIEWVRHFAQALDAFAEQARAEEREACELTCRDQDERYQKKREGAEARGDSVGAHNAGAKARACHECADRIRARGGSDGE